MDWRHSAIFASSEAALISVGTFPDGVLCSDGDILGVKETDSQKRLS